MRFIKLENQVVKDEKTDINLDAKETLLSILRAKSDGFTIDEMRKAVKLMDMVESSDKWLSLEDADYDYLKQRVSTFRWGFAHHAIIRFNDLIDSAEKEEPEELILAKAAGVEKKAAKK